MGKHPVVLNIIFSLALSPALNAQESTSVCKPKTGTELFKCLNEQHIDIKKSELDQIKADGELSQAGNIPNPELGLGGVVGDNFGQRTTEIQADLQFTLELGGKRKARKNKAQSEKSLAEIDTKLTFDQVKIDSAQTVLRLKQLNKEISSFKEALETFSRIERQYRSRGRLSPEQEVSLAVFEVAAKDTALKLNSLFEEQNLVQDSVLVLIGQKGGIDWKLISLSDFQPKLPERFDEKSTATSPHIEKVNIEATRAEQSLEIEQANAWPDFKIGPVLKSTTEGGDRFYSGGVGISFPFPLFNVNGGAKTAAASQVQKATLEAQRKTHEITLLKSRLKENYERLRTHTVKMNDIDALDKKHRRLEALFSQGVVSSALVIESHRQLLEFLQEYHTAERSQLEILWKLYSLEGRLQQEVTL